MRILLVCLALIYSQLAHSDGKLFTVVWWNIACPGQNPQAVESEILKSLNAIKNSTDFLALGEFCLNKSGDKVLKELNSDFPHALFLPYRPGESSGLYVFSKYQMSLLNTQKLSWYKDISEKKKWEDQFGPNPTFDRHYNLIEVSMDSVSINISPAHMLNPWTAYKKLGLVSTAKEVFWGKSNPLIRQIEFLIQNIETDFGSLIVNPFILLGDFNTPSNFPGGMGYKTLSTQFADSMNEDTTTSFIPDNVKIDHIFHSGNIKSIRSQVLLLNGSDHRPVSTTFFVPTK